MLASRLLRLQSPGKMKEQLSIAVPVHIPGLHLAAALGQERLVALRRFQLSCWARHKAILRSQGKPLDGDRQEFTASYSHTLHRLVTHDAGIPLRAEEPSALLLLDARAAERKRLAAMESQQNDQCRPWSKESRVLLAEGSFLRAHGY